MVHLPALPGAAAARLPMDRIIERAVGEAQLLAKAGFDAVIVENFGDTPFAADDAPRETIAAMAVVVDHVARAVQIPVGANVLRNDGLAALSIAAVTGAGFVRINVLSGVYATDQGLISGRAREVLALRQRIAPHVKIAADVHVKHATPISQPDIALAAEETAYRAGADILIVSGPATGKPADLEAVRRVSAAVPDRPVWVGSGVTAETLRESLKAAQGVIAGTCLKKGGVTTEALDAERVRGFVGRRR
jgi:membrane complex biogenesis BtpA family protein